MRQVWRDREEAPMTTVYVPRLIESAEQAEALPIRTPVLMGPFVAHRPFADKGWVVTDAGGEYSSEELIAAHSHLNPTALVPIEAEERIGVELRHQISDKRYDIHVMGSSGMDNALWQVKNNPDHATGRIMRQYRTPWEEA